MHNKEKTLVFKIYFIYEVWCLTPLKIHLLDSKHWEREQERGGGREWNKKRFKFSFIFSDSVTMGPWKVYTHAASPLTGITKPRPSTIA
jgi:hypothetical protein